MESLILLEVAAAGLSLAKMVHVLELVWQLLLQVLVSVRSVLRRWMLLPVSRKRLTISEPI